MMSMNAIVSKQSCFSSSGFPLIIHQNTEKSVAIISEPRYYEPRYSGATLYFFCQKFLQPLKYFVSC